jgi:membrane protease YdiL (CAAX protease family)
MTLQALSLKWPILGVLIAIAITATMDANGLSAFSALPLFPLVALFWYLQRLPRRSMGFAWGQGRHYGLALLFPALVLGLIALVSAVAGAVDISHTNWGKAALNCLLISASTVLVVILTEEGFFRGWLWASLERTGETPSRIVIWSSIAFALWHVSAVVLNTGFNPPPAQVPTFLVNAALLGAAWGLMRWSSGSVIVASVSHGVWNGLAYVLFGFGTRTGALGIKETWLYGPEVGVLGLALNAIFAIVVWRRIHSGRRETDEDASSLQAGDDSGFGRAARDGERGATETRDGQNAPGDETGGRPGVP